MSEIHFARLSYSTLNLGDDLQTEATLSFLKNTTVSFNRDELATVRRSEKYLIIMNGWWSAAPQNSFPPANCFTPVFIGFHIAGKHQDYFLQPHCLDYFKKNQPIGCRDTFTVDLLQQQGVQSFMSGCLTTTFAKRLPSTDQNQAYLVDTDMVDHLIPDHILRNATRLTHNYDGPPHMRQKAVDDLMHHYRSKAALVITSRLHAALTCTALGVPVIYFSHPDDPRNSTARQVGLKIYRSHYSLPSTVEKIIQKTKLTNLRRSIEKKLLRMKYSFFQKINWNPKPLNIEAHKQELIAITEKAIKFFS